MAFRILQKVKDGGSTLNSLYKFVSTVDNGVTSFKEFSTKAEVDEYVEEQLNAGVPKTSLEVVAVMNYTVSASIDTEDCGCQESTTNTPSTDESENSGNTEETPGTTEGDSQPGEGTESSGSTTEGGEPTEGSGE